MSKKKITGETFLDSLVNPPELNIGSDDIEGLVPLTADNIDQVTEELDDRSKENNSFSFLPMFSEYFTPIKGKKRIVPKSDAIVRFSDPEVLETLTPRMERATTSDTAQSIMPSPGKFFNPTSAGYKGDKFSQRFKDAGIDVDMEYGNFVMMGRTPKDVTNETFQNLYVSPRTSYKYSEGQNKAVARANPYSGPTLTVEEMQQNYKQNTGKKGSKVQTNLLQPTQFKVKLEDNDFRTADHPIVAVEGKGKHHYTLDMQMVGPVRMNQLTKKAKRKKKTGEVVEELPQPNLRPVTVGDVVLGNIVGYITVQGNEHPLYDYIEVDGSASAPDKMKENTIEKFNEGGLVEMAHGGLMIGDMSDGCGCPSCMMKKIMGVDMGMSDMVGVDPVSGNEIPPGSNAENVRDDLPVMLSDGEYVMPADAVRYHGLKFLDSLRMEAKAGLMAMMAEGQIQTIEEEEEAQQYVDNKDENEDDEDNEEVQTYTTEEGNEVEEPEMEVTTKRMSMFMPYKPSQSFAFVK